MKSVSNQRFFFIFAALPTCCSAVNGCTALITPEDEVIKCEVVSGIDPCSEQGQECGANGICGPIQPKPPPDTTPPPDPIECVPVSVGRDPCPQPENGEERLYCVDGFCRPCQPGQQDVQELCNGIDDNCNGEVDEGHDADGDGYTWCGAGNRQRRDCDEGDPAIHPANPMEDVPDVVEICDGKDNDCNGEIDEIPECVPTVPGCDPSDPSTCECDPEDPSTCGPGLNCDPTTLRCVAPLELGGFCNNDAACGDGICVDPAAVNLEQRLRGDKFCSRACCTDEDCPQDTVCLIAGTGARVCVPANFAERETKRAGESCRRSTECASGVCAQGTCQTACTSDADCGESYCIFDSDVSFLAYVGNPGQFVCGDAQGAGEPGMPCFSAANCRSGLCSAALCTVPCGSSAECMQYDPAAVCDYHETQAITGISLVAGTRVSICFIPLPGVEISGTVCCKDEHCEADTKCRPHLQGDLWGMYCMTESLE